MLILFNRIQARPNQTSHFDLSFSLYDGPQMSWQNSLMETLSFQWYTDLILSRKIFVLNYCNISLQECDVLLCIWGDNQFVYVMDYSSYHNYKTDTI